MAKSTRTHYVIHAYSDEGISTFKITSKVAKPIVKPLGYYAAAKCEYEVMCNGATLANAYRVKCNKYTGEEVSIEFAYTAASRLVEGVKRFGYKI